MQILFGLYSWFFQACRYTSSQFTHKVMSFLVYPLPRWLVRIFSSKMPFATYFCLDYCLLEETFPGDVSYFYIMMASKFCHLYY